MKAFAGAMCVVFVFFCSFASAQTLTGPQEITEQTAPAMPAPPAKQAIPLKAVPNTGNQPLEITADGSLTWKRNEKIFIAHGNAVASQGDSSISAETLTARYEEKKGAGMKISSVLAEEKVIIRSKDTEAFGAKADYDLDKGYAVMTGSDLRLVSPDQIVTAQDKFEYFVTEGRLVATGRAKATRTQDTLEADTLIAIMKNDSKGKRVLDRLEAEGNVVITTSSEVVTGQHGIYHAATDKAELTGGVKVKRGPNTLEGDRAEVDLKTNTSQIFGGAHVAGGRVRGVFYPGSDKAGNKNAP